MDRAGGERQPAGLALGREESMTLFTQLCPVLGLPIRRWKFKTSLGKQLIRQVISKQRQRVTYSQVQCGALASGPRFGCSCWVMAPALQSLLQSKGN